MRILFTTLMLLLTVHNLALADDHVARIVKLENSSQIFVPFNPELKTKDKLVKYLDKTYRIIPATRGMKLENGYIVTTGPLSKLKIIFKNGDHFFISNNTQYEIKWGQEEVQAKEKSTMSILRGAVRGLIEKGGPRSGMKIITRNVVMGVRGTDFHIFQHNSGLTQISVLRGAIDLEDENKKETIHIGGGQTFMKKKNNSQLSQLTKKELKTIAQQTSIHSSEVPDKNLNDLENKAKEVTIKDINLYNPGLLKEMMSKGGTSSDELAASTIEALEKTAPETSKKPDWADLMDEKDPYETYKPRK